MTTYPECPFNEFMASKGMRYWTLLQRRTNQSMSRIRARCPHGDHRVFITPKQYRDLRAEARTAGYDID